MIKVSNVTAGIFFMLGSSFCFALMNAFAKSLSSYGIPSMENVFFRSIVMVAIVLLVYSYEYARHKPKKTMKKGGYFKLLVRVGMGGFAMACTFYNIATIPLGTATAFAQSVPIYAVIMGIIFLGEKVNIAILLATLLGFVGLLCISNPSFSGIGIDNVIVGILSGLSMAVAFVTLRSLKQYFSNEFLVLAFGAGTAIIGFLGMFIPVKGVGGFVLPGGVEWLLILAMGGCGTVAQFLLNKAYMNAPVGIVAPIDYSRILFSLLFGIILGDSFPSLLTTSGIILIIVSGVMIAMPSLLKDIKRMYEKH